MALSAQELEMLKANSLNLHNAKAIGDMINDDMTAGGIFAHGEEEDFSNPDIEAFKNKYCGWWPIARILLNLAKIFTKKKGDRVLNEMIKLGDEVCK